MSLVSSGIEPCGSRFEPNCTVGVSFVEAGLNLLAVGLIIVAVGLFFK